LGSHSFALGIRDFNRFFGGCGFCPTGLEAHAGLLFDQPSGLLYFGYLRGDGFWRGFGGTWDRKGRGFEWGLFADV
jgi:hypothetical protein